MGGGGDLQVMMDDESSGGGGDSARPNFTFAFNDSNFSDRVLRIEVIAAPADAKASAGGSTANDDWARQKKRRRADRAAADRGSMQTGVMYPGSATDGQEEQVINGNLDDAEDAPHDLEEDATVMMEESSPSPGLEESSQGQTPWCTSTGPVVRTTLIHVSSAILAAKSPFFYKLFSNGMRESDQRDVTIRISTTEEDALMDLLQFMYSGKLKAEVPTAVLDVLMAADKFEVSACMRHCSRLLRKLDMTPESALLYLELPSNVLLAEAVQPLTDTARSFLASRYKDIARHAEDVLNLPLAGLEAVLSSDELQVASEDALYEFVLKWAKAHISKPEERREVLASRLAWLIRFPMMSSRKLRKVLTCSDFEPDFAQKLVVEALFFRTEPPYRQRQLALDEPHHKRFSERAYKYRPVKMVEFERPFQQCHVYLDLKLDECKSLYPQGRLYSQAFHLGGQGFFLSAHCNLDQTSTCQCFGLFLGMQEKGSLCFLVDYEFAARMRPSWEFVTKSTGTYNFTGGKAVGYRNLFALSWDDFINDGPYFHDGVLHLRADLTIKDTSSNGNGDAKR